MVNFFFFIINFTLITSVGVAAKAPKNPAIEEALLKKYNFSISYLLLRKCLIYKHEMCRSVIW